MSKTVKCKVKDKGLRRETPESKWVGSDVRLLPSFWMNSSGPAQAADSRPVSVQTPDGPHMHPVGTTNLLQPPSSGQSLKLNKDPVEKLSSSLAPGGLSPDPQPVQSPEDPRRAQPEGHPPNTGPGLLRMSRSRRAGKPRDAAAPRGQRSRDGVVVWGPDGTGRRGGGWVEAVAWSPMFPA